MDNRSMAISISLGLAMNAFSATVDAAQQSPPSPAPASPPPPFAPPPAAPADADQPTAESRSTMSNAISAFGAIGYSYGFAVGLGVGARYQLTLVPKGFLKPNQRVHDDLALEPGFDFFHAGYSTGGPGNQVSWDYNEVTPLVGVVWNVWLNDKVAVYPKIDIGYRFSSWSESVNGMSTGNAIHADLFPLYFQGAGGVVYRMGIVSLRAEVGWAVLRAGLALNLF